VRKRSKRLGFRTSALDEKQHPSARYCVGDVGGERRQARCEWVRLWPLSDERNQIELLAGRVIP
jgi:hypothetical protein